MTQTISRECGTWGKSKGDTPAFCGGDPIEAVQETTQAQS